MSENNICTICGGYIGNATLHATLTSGSASLPPMQFCPGHSMTDAELHRPFTMVHEFHPENELVFIPKHDGNLDDRDPHHSYHAGVELQEDYGACDGSKVVYIHGGHGDCESSSMYLDLKQALSLLSWLQQERLMLARLIQEVPRD